MWLCGGTFRPQTNHRNNCNTKLFRFWNFEYFSGRRDQFESQLHLSTWKRSLWRRFRCQHGSFAASIRANDRFWLNSIWASTWRNCSLLNLTRDFAFVREGILVFVCLLSRLELADSPPLPGFCFHHSHLRPRLFSNRRSGSCLFRLKLTEKINLF